MTAQQPVDHILDLEKVRAVMVSHVDNAGISRVKILPGHKLLGSLPGTGTTVSMSAGLLMAVDDYVVSTPEIDSAMGDLRGMPDLAAARMIDAQAGLAWAPSDLHSLDGTPHPACPRSLLKRVVAEAERDGFTFDVGLELEFILFRGDRDDPELAHVGPGYGVRPFLELEAWHLDLLSALRAAGLPVDQINPEYGVGQAEVTLGPRDPVGAVDDYVLARHIVTRVSLAHGLLPSFQPVAVVDGTGSGCHIHFSARRDGTNIFSEPGARYGMTEDAEHMIAGIQARLAESVAVLTGTTLSFLRLQPEHWSGAAVCWGIGNREAAIRYMPGYPGLEQQQSNIEVKCPDASANPYTATAVLIAAALEGARARTPLAEPARTAPSRLTAEEKTASRVHPFPTSLSEALEAVEASSFAREVLGETMLNAVVAVRRRDAEVFEGLPAEEVVARTRWRQ
jgi:glutamine synthetase